MDFKKLNKRIEIKYETQIKWMVVLVVLTYAMTYLYDITARIPDLLRTNVVTCIIKILIVIPPILVYKKWAIHHEKYDFKNWKQYIYGLALIVPLHFCKTFVYGWGYFQPERLLHVGLGKLLWLFFFYMILTAVGEEFFCRQYIQGELEVILGKAKWLAPLVSAAIFGYWHIVQGDVTKVYFTFLFGLILGYAKFFFKDCTMLSVIIAHGLYDILAVTTGL